MKFLAWLFNRRANCAELLTLSLEERANAILRDQVLRLREQCEKARQWNNQCAVRMARILEENGRLRCEVARMDLEVYIMKHKETEGTKV